MFWKIVVCGGRDRAFRDWTKQPLDARYPIRILLVDAEGPVSGGVRAHLELRDSWMIPKAEEENVHLMVQTMETWIGKPGSGNLDRETWIGKPGSRLIGRRSRTTTAIASSLPHCR